MVGSESRRLEPEKPSAMGVVEEARSHMESREWPESTASEFQAQSNILNLLRPSEHGSRHKGKGRMSSTASVNPDLWRQGMATALVRYEGNPAVLTDDSSTSITIWNRFASRSQIKRRRRSSVL